MAYFDYLLSSLPSLPNPLNSNFLNHTYSRISRSVLNTSGSVRTFWSGPKSLPWLHKGEHPGYEASITHQASLWAACLVIMGACGLSAARYFCRNRDRRWFALSKHRKESIGTAATSTDEDGSTSIMSFKGKDLSAVKKGGFASRMKPSNGQFPHLEPLFVDASIFG